MKLRHLLFLLVIVSAFPLIFRIEGAARSQTAVRRGPLQLTLCNNPSVTADALCGTFEVYEDRAQRTGRKIPLNPLKVS